MKACQDQPRLLIDGFTSEEASAEDEYRQASDWQRHEIKSGYQLKSDREKLGRLSYDCHSHLIVTPTHLDKRGEGAVSRRHMRSPSRQSPGTHPDCIHV